MEPTFLATVSTSPHSSYISRYRHAVANALTIRLLFSDTVKIVSLPLLNLVFAKDRGAKIRIITDRLMAKNKSSLVEELSDAGIPVLTNVKHKIEHNKFAVFGGRVVVTGSYNWTNNATKSNSENCLFFEQPNKEYSE